MKKTFFFVFCICIIFVVIFVLNVRDLQRKQRETQRFNQIYEAYQSDDLDGLDITTVINKAMNNNESYTIPKDENGEYIPDDMYSVKIYITMIINGKTYPMERIHALGIEAFVEYFDSVDFKCTDIQYHEKTGRVSEMTFEATEY